MSETAHISPDINVFLHFPALDGLDWCGLAGSENVVLHITQAFLADLNKAKDAGGSAAVRKRAKAVQRRLKGILRGDDAKLPDRVAIEFLASTPDLSAFPKLNPNVADDALLAAVLLFRESHEDLVLIATDDDGLGLLVKCGSYGIRVVEPPEEARLAPEPDEKEAELRRLRTEVETLRNARPKVALHFKDGSHCLQFQREKIDVDAKARAYVQRLGEEYPQLMVPEKVRRDPFAAITMQEILLTPEKVAAYNQQLLGFFGKSEAAARSLWSLKARTIFFSIVASNAGSAPAGDLAIHLHFPGGFELRDKETWDNLLSDLPEPPRKPRHPFADAASWRAPEHSRIAAMRPPGPPQPSLSIRKANSYDVQFKPPKLRQGHDVEVGEFALTFEGDPFSFECEYSAVADNLPEVLTGRLYFVASAAVPS